MLELLDKSLSTFFKTANLDSFLKLEDAKVPSISFPFVHSPNDLSQAIEEMNWMLLLTFLNYQVRNLHQYRLSASISCFVSQLTLLIYNVVSNFCLPSICSTSDTIKFTLNQHTVSILFGVISIFVTCLFRWKRTISRVSRRIFRCILKIRNS